MKRFITTVLITLCAPAAGYTAQEVSGTNPYCVDSDIIARYVILSDSQATLYTEGGDTFLMTLNKTCPQLKFHQYFSFTPINGQLCAGESDIQSRAGFTCRVKSLELLEEIEKTK